MKPSILGFSSLYNNRFLILAGVVVRSLNYQLCYTDQLP